MGNQYQLPVFDYSVPISDAVDALISAGRSAVLVREETQFRLIDASALIAAMNDPSQSLLNVSSPYTVNLFLQTPDVDLLQKYLSPPGIKRCENPTIKHYYPPLKADPFDPSRCHCGYKIA